MASTPVKKSAAKKTAANQVPSQTAAPAKKTAATTRSTAAVKKALVAPDIRTELLDVTPAMADAWLKANIGNRRLSDRTVDLYARDMAAGRWLMNGEAIQLAVDGTLLNGQHRLAAIVKSGVTVKMLVIFNLPRATQETMDAGRKRTPVDFFVMRGESNTKALAAIARRVALWERGDRSFRDVASFGEVSDLLKAHPEIRRSAEIAERVHRSFKPLSVSVLGTSHFLLHQVSPEDTPWFFGAIERGAGLDEGNPVLTLRERIRNDKDTGVQVNDVRAIGYVVRAWNAHREGRKLTRMQHAIGEPIPEIL
jgi:hypothetical protein